MSLLERITHETNRRDQVLALIGAFLFVFGPAVFIIWAGTR